MRGVIDLMIFSSASELAPLAAGWATKEACVRPNIRYCKELVQELEQCIECSERMNRVQISRQLKAKYKWQPNMNLRPSQVQGWVSSEVLRKKKKAMLASLEWGEADVLAMEDLPS